jgi:hypothetical protein
LRREGDTASLLSDRRKVVRYEMTRGLIFSIRAERSDSAAASCFVASFAVLLFEPHTTMPSSNNETAAAMNPRSDRITPTSIAARTTRQHGDPGGQDEFAAALNLGSKIFNMLLEPDDFRVGTTIV